MNPLAMNLVSQVSANLLNVTLEDKVKNPITKSVLNPLIQNFVQGIMLGLSGKQMSNQSLPEAYSNKATPPYPAKLYDQMILNNPILSQGKGTSK